VPGDNDFMASPVKEQPNPSRRRTIMFSNILVPTDGSKLSQKAVALAVQLAKLTNAKLIALHVYPRFSGSPYGTFGPSEDVIAKAHTKQHKAEAEKLFAAVKKLTGAAGVALDTALVESDDVYKQVIAVAKRKKCDLICMASHGRRGLSGIVLGSETHKVLTHSKIPVMVLR
jgi:nucleotide-binding universal stress UspA family protein